MRQSGTAARSTSDSELGFASLGALLRMRSQTFCVVHWKGTRPSSMLISVTLGDGDPWMRPFSRWICRRMTGQRSGSSPLLIVNPRSMLP